MKAFVFGLLASAFASLFPQQSFVPPRRDEPARQQHGHERRVVLPPTSADDHSAPHL